MKYTYFLIILLVKLIFVDSFPGPNLQQTTENPSVTSYKDTLFVAGGNFDEQTYSSFLVFNFTTNVEIYHTISPRIFATSVVVGELVIIAGGETPNETPLDDITLFSITANEFVTTTQRLSVARAGISSTSLGPLAFFAAGNINGVGVPIIEIYNTSSDSLQVFNMEKNCSLVAATTYGDVALFLTYQRFYTYTLTTNQWNETSVPFVQVEPLNLCSFSPAVTLNSKSYFLFCDAIYVYNHVEQQWENSLNSTLPGPKAATILNELILIGAYYGPNSDINVYNTTSGSWEEDYPLWVPRANFGAATLDLTNGQVALFVGGSGSEIAGAATDEYSYCYLGNEYLVEFPYSNCSNEYPPTTTTEATSTTGSEKTDYAQDTIPFALSALVLAAIFISIIYIVFKKIANKRYLKYSLLSTNVSVPKIKNVTIKKLLGSGQFSNVYEGTWNKVTPVAIKKLKSQQHMDEFEREVAILCTLNHPNCVHLYGIYEENNEKMMVLEYLPLGDLSKLLQREASNFSELDLLFIAEHVLNGMCYLIENHVLHRDLALRNVLVSKQMDGKYVAKVSDFGLSRIESADYYRTDDKTLAVKWAAIESIQYGKFSEKSDVWSFGVCLWELFSYGKIPFAGLPNSDVIQKVSEGYILPCPENCPNDVYDVMKMCWNKVPEDRPSFFELAEIFATFTSGYENEPTLMANVEIIIDNNSVYN